MNCNRHVLQVKALAVVVLFFVANVDGSGTSHLDALTINSVLATAIKFTSMSGITRAARARVFAPLGTLGLPSTGRTPSRRVRSSTFVANDNLFGASRNQSLRIPQWIRAPTPKSRSPYSFSRTLSLFHQRSQSSPSTLWMSSTSSSTTEPQSITELSNEERVIYRELSLLSAKLRKLDESYYGDTGTIAKGVVEGQREIDKVSTTVSDDEYDALARREAELCTTHPNLLALLESESGLGKRATRFGGRVGKLYDGSDDGRAVAEQTTTKKTKSTPKRTKSTTKKRVKRQHLISAPMQSLDNAMDVVEAVAWLNRVRRLLLAADKETNSQGEDDSEINDTQAIPIQIMAEPKIDGLSLSLRYGLRKNTAQDDEECVYDFVWGSTRGDGTQGEDVTETVQTAWMKSDNGDSLYYSIPQHLRMQQHGLESEDTSSPPLVIEIRGEVVLPQDSFDEFRLEVSNSSNTNETTAVTFSNARNAASGILLRTKEPTSTEELERTRWLQSRLRFYAYDVVASSSSTGNSSWLDHLMGTNVEEMRSWLNDLGFHVPSPVVLESLMLSTDKEVNETDVPKLLEYHNKLMTSRDERTIAKGKRSNAQLFPYQIDGVVYKLSSFQSRQICGSSSRTPRWAIAHKFPPQSAITRLLDVDIQVGRTGALTPVAILDPVVLGGVVVSRASLHNFHFARKILLPRNDVHESVELPNTDMKNDNNSSVKKGISVLVSRAGDVIPQVMKRIFDDDIEAGITAYDGLISLDPPKACPACGSPTSFEFLSTPSKKSKRKKVEPQVNDMDALDEEVDDANDTESGQVLRCSGPQLLCQPRAVNAMAYAYSRQGLDIKGLSKAKLQQLMEEQIIRFPVDLFVAFGNKSSGESSRRTGEDMNGYDTP